jgi:hypothetical protein
MSELYILAERDPRECLAGLLQDVVGQRPLVVPGLDVERLTPARQVVEVAALLGLPNLTIDRGLPLSHAA